MSRERRSNLLYLKGLLTRGQKSTKSKEGGGGGRESIMVRKKTAQNRRQGKKGGLSEALLFERRS